MSASWPKLEGADLVECACSGVVDLVYLLGLLSQNCILFKPPSLSRCCEAKYF